MGESLLVENKMMSGESIAHVPCIQESVSFGRFEDDSLCWERWSTFPTTNKYLKEVEKFSTPGSVAQKKAYFEAHYKRVIARKAELLDQEREREAELMNSEDQSQSLIIMDEENEVVNFSIQVVGDHDIDEPEGVADVIVDVIEENEDLQPDPEDSAEDFVKQEADSSLVSQDKSEEREIAKKETQDSLELVKEMHKVVGDHNIDEPEGVADVIADVIEENEDLHPDPEDCAEDFVKQEPDSSLVSQDKSEEREIAKKETQDSLELVKEMHKATQVMKKKTTDSTSARKKPTSQPMIMSKGSATSIPRKSATPASQPMMPKRSATSIPRKSAAPAQKSPLLSAPKSSKPVLSKTVKKETSRPETKRVFPSSLHMSLSLEPTNSTRKSLIMESMGDKEIVKRAFKAFQNGKQVSSSGLARSPASNQSATKTIEQNGSGSGTLQKKREGNLRSVKEASALSSLQGTGKTSLSTGLRKTAGVNQRNGKPIPSSFSSRSLDLGNKQKEVSKKLEQKAKEASKIHLQSKATLEKSADMRRLSQSINSKAKLSSSYNQGPPLRVLLKDVEFFTRR